MAEIITRETFDDRWTIVTMRMVRERTDEGTWIREDTAKDVLKLLDTIVDIGARVYARQVRGDEEEDLFDIAGQLLNGPIKEALFAWVSARPESWAKWREGIDAAARAQLATATA